MLRIVIHELSDMFQKKKICGAKQQNYIILVLPKRLAFLQKQPKLRCSSCHQSVNDATAYIHMLLQPSICSEIVTSSSEEAISDRHKEPK